MAKKKAKAVSVDPAVLQSFVDEVHRHHQVKIGNKSAMICGVPKSEFLERLKSAGLTLGALNKAAFPSVPCRNYVFGCSAPLSFQKEVSTELYRVHKYRNDFVAFRQECNKREYGIVVSIAESDPEYVELTAEIDSLNKVIGESEGLMKEQRVKRRSKKDSHGDSSSITALRDKRKVLLKKRSARLNKIRKSDEYKSQWQVEKKRLESQQESRRKSLYRRGGELECYSGTTGIVDLAAPDRFKSFDGSGCMRRQVIRNSDFFRLLKPISSAKGSFVVRGTSVFVGDGKEMELQADYECATFGGEKKADGEWVFGSQRLAVAFSREMRKKMGCEVEKLISEFRVPKSVTHYLTHDIGTSSHPKPVFVICMHRDLSDLSPTSKICEYRIIRQPSGLTRCVDGHDQQRYIWKIMVTVKDPEGVFFGSQEPESDDVVGLDVGWREGEDGSLNVCTTVSTSGAVHHFTIPTDIQKMTQRAAEIDSERGIAIESFRKVVGECIEDEWDELPEAVQEILLPPPERRSEDSNLKSSAKRSVAALKSPRRIGKIVACVLHHMKSGYLYDAAVGWRKQYCRTGGFGVVLKRRISNKKKNFYKELANAIRRAYRVIVVEDIDLAKIGEKSDVGESDNSGVRKNKVIASVGMLIPLLGARVKRVNPANTSKTCSCCGCVNEIGSARSWSCEECGTEWDRDENACINIMSRAGIARGGVIDAFQGWKSGAFCVESPAERKLSQIESQGGVWAAL